MKKLIRKLLISCTLLLIILILPNQTQAQSTGMSVSPGKNIITLLPGDSQTIEWTFFEGNSNQDRHFTIIKGSDSWNFLSIPPNEQNFILKESETEKKLHLHITVPKSVLPNTIVKIPVSIRSLRNNTTNNNGVGVSLVLSGYVEVHVVAEKKTVHNLRDDPQAVHSQNIITAPSSKLSWSNQPISLHWMVRNDFLGTVDQMPYDFTIQRNGQPFSSSHAVLQQERKMHESGIISQVFVPQHTGIYHLSLQVGDMITTSYLWVWGPKEIIILIILVLAGVTAILKRKR